MSLRVVVVAAILTLVNCQCAFNSLGIFRGTTRYDGITIGTTSTVVTPSPASQIGCVVGGGLPVGTSCTFTAAGYIGSVIASCDATGWVYSPSNTLSPLNCPNYFSVGLSASGTHLVGERLSYTCSPGTYCSTDPCEAACDETTPGFFAVTPPLTCTTNCLIGNTPGMTVAVTVQGSGGASCFGTTVPGITYSPTCSVSASTGYVCTGLPLSGLRCSGSNPLIPPSVSCDENMCLPSTITTTGVIGDPSNGFPCSIAAGGVILNVITTTSCDVMCDQASGYELKKGTFNCGSVGNLAAGQAATTTLTSCETVPCPVNSQRVTSTSCSCQNGYIGGVTYNGTSYVGMCHRPGIKITGRVGGGITSEAGLQDTVTVELESQPTVVVTLTASTDTVTEGVVSPTSITFSTTNWNTPQTLTVTGVDDLIQDAGVPYKVIVDSVSGDPEYNGLSAYWDLVNNDNDAAAIAKSLPFTGMPQTTSEDGTSGYISFNTRTRPLSNVEIRCSSSIPGEGLLQPERITIVPSQWNIVHTINVVGQDDDVVDGGIAYSVSCVVSSNDAFYDGFVLTNSDFVNNDNDSAAIVFSNTAILLYEDPNSSSKSANISLKLASMPTSSVTVLITSNDPSESLLSVFPVVSYSPTLTIVIAPADWDQLVVFSVKAVDDNEVDGDQFGSLFITITTTDTGYSALSTSIISVRTIDWNVAGVMFCNNFTSTTSCDDRTTALIPGETQEQNNGVDDIRVRLTTKPTSSVTLQWSSSDTTEGVLQTDTLTFTTVNWGTWQTITVTGQDDAIDDGDVWYQIDYVSLTTTDVNYNSYGRTLVPTSGLSSVNLVSEPSRFLRATLLNIDNDVDECRLSTTVCSYNCVDPDLRNLNDWTCNCLWPNQGTNTTATDASCFLDECLSRSQVCLLASQTCIDVDMATNSTGDWECECLAPSTGWNGVAQAAMCNFDECILHNNVCTSSDVGQRQSCVDPNTDFLSRNDWYCLCSPPRNGTNVTAKATCTIDECNSTTTCVSPGFCVDPDLNPLSSNNYFCDCPLPYTSNQSTEIARLAYRGAICYFDECTVQSNNDTCTRGNNMQECFDTDTNALSLNDWVCRCISPAVGTAQLMTSITCDYDECLRNSTVTCDPGVWWHSGTGNGFGHAYNQSCFDVNINANSLHDWRCACDFPAVGSADLQPAICTVDECVLGRATCGTETVCVDPNTNTHDLSSANDWYCICPYPQVFNTTFHTQGNFTVSPSSHRPPSCILDECLVNSVICEASSQTCMDPNTSISSVGDWGCTCVTETTSEFSNQSVATCLLDECMLQSTTCGPSQGCNDTNKAADSRRDWNCTCPAGQNGSSLGGPANCHIDECETFDCGTNQTCTDRNTSFDSRHDFYCTCDSPWEGEMRAWVAVCVHNECDINKPTCEQVNQDCIDPTNGLDDWRCVCRSPWVGADGNQEAAMCMYDECITITHCDDFGQDCVDLDKFSSDSWVCKCRSPLSGNDGVGEAAVCTIDECSDPLIDAICVNSNQVCSDDDITSQNNWKCSCAPPLAGVSTASAALCTVDLCVGLAAATCTSVGQTCTQRGIQWYCDCLPPSMGNSSLQSTASCRLDQCSGMGGDEECSKFGQVCKDDGTGWKCHCREPYTGSPVQGKATCLLDECSIKPRCNLPFQICIDQNNLKTSDWLCRCQSPSVGNDSLISDAVCVWDECSPGSNKQIECSNLGQSCLDSDPTTKNMNNSKCILCTEASKECNTNLKTECDNSAIRGICERDGNQRCFDRNITTLNDWECVCQEPLIGRSVASRAVCVNPTDLAVDNAANVRSSTNNDGENFPIALLIVAIVLPIVCASGLLIWQKNKRAKKKKKYSDDDFFDSPSKDVDVATPLSGNKPPPVEVKPVHDDFTFSRHPVKQEINDDFDFGYSNYKPSGVSNANVSYKRPLGRGVDVTVV